MSEVTDRPDLRPPQFVVSKHLVRRFLRRRPSTFSREVSDVAYAPRRRSRCCARCLQREAYRTEDPTRDLSSATLAGVRRKLESLPHAGRYLAVLEGEEPRDDRALGRIFGEELPSGLVLAANADAEP